MRPPVDSTAAAILAQLRDIHTPEALGWWPPAFGWWLIFFVVAGTIGFVSYRAAKHWRQVRCPAWHALNELDDLWDDYDNNKDALHALRNLSSLMRRTAISLDTGRRAALLSGDAWLEWLDLYAPQKMFAVSDSGRAFADIAYKKPDNTDVEELFELCAVWLEHNSDKRMLDAPPSPDNNPAGNNLTNRPQ